MLSSTRDAFGAGLVWAMGLLAFIHVATWALHGAGWVLAGHGWSSTVVDGWLSELTLLAPTVVCWLALSRVGLGGPQVLLPAAAMTLYIAGSTSFGFVGGAGSAPLPFVAEHGVLSFYPLEPAASSSRAKRCAGWGSPFDEQVKVRICCGTCGILLRYWQQERPSPTLVRASDLREYSRGDRI